MTDANTSSLPRLYVDSALTATTSVAATEGQSHYLLHVMRRGAGDEVAVFNGRDGEWSAVMDVVKKRHVSFTVHAQRRPQSAEPEIALLFAPLKAGPLEFLVEKATELGVSALMPVITRRTVVNRINHRRLEAVAMEAAEQCERLTVPSIAAPRPLDEVLAEWAADQKRRLLFLDEGVARDGGATPIAAVLSGKDRFAAILVGPEGGFAPDEQDFVRRQTYITSVVLGPRILRAETAALAALSCWQALQGNARGPG